MLVGMHLAQLSSSICFEKKNFLNPFRSLYLHKPRPGKKASTKPKTGTPKGDSPKMGTSKEGTPIDEEDHPAPEHSNSGALLTIGNGWFHEDSDEVLNGYVTEYNNKDNLISHPFHCIVFF